MAAETAVLVSTYLDDKTPTNLCISTLIESVTERQSLQGSVSGTVVVKVVYMV